MMMNPNVPASDGMWDDLQKEEKDDKRNGDIELDVAPPDLPRRVSFVAEADVKNASPQKLNALIRAYRSFIVYKETHLWVGMLFIALSRLSLVSDVVSDLIVATELLHEGHPIWAAFSYAFTFGAYTASWLLNLKQLWRQADPEGPLKWAYFCSPCCLCISCAALLSGFEVTHGPADALMRYRYSRLIFFLCVYVLMGPFWLVMLDVAAVTLYLGREMPTHLSPVFAFYTKQRAVLEVWCESLPQLALQCYIRLFSDDIQIDDTALAVSIFFSVLSISKTTWALYSGSAATGTPFVAYTKAVLTGGSADPVATYLEMHPNESRWILHEQGINDEMAQTVATAVKKSETVEQILLANNFISDDGVELIVDAMKSAPRTKVRVINIARNMVTDRGASALADALACVSSFDSLDLRDNRIGDAGAKRLGFALATSNTKSLTLAGNEAIGVDGILALLVGLDRSQSRDLELHLSQGVFTPTAWLCSDKNLTDRDAMSIGQALQQCLSVRLINILNNALVTEAGIRSIAQSLSVNQSAYFSADGTVISDAVRTELKREYGRRIQFAHRQQVLRREGSPDRLVQDEVRAVVSSPDGVHVVTAQGRAALLWDVSTGACVREMAHEAEVVALAWSPLHADQDQLHWLAVATAFRVVIWDTRTGVRVAEFAIDASGLRPDHDECQESKLDVPDVVRVVWRPSGAPEIAVLAAGSGTVQVWDVNNQQRMHELRHDADCAVRALAWSLDGRRIATGGDNETLIVWDSATGELVRQFDHHKGRVGGISVHCVAWSPCGRWLASAAGQYFVMCDASTGELSHDEHHYQAGLTQLDWSPDGRWLASLSQAQSCVTLWASPNITRANLNPRDKASPYVHELRFHVKTTCMSWSPQGDWLAMSGADGWTTLFEGRSGNRMQNLRDGHSGPVHQIAWAPDGSWLATAGADGTTGVWW